MLYFVQLSSAPERVKIGKAHDVPRRMYELSRYPSSAWRDQAEHASGASLVLRAQCEGYSETEAALHRMLAPHRLHGEWFDANAPLVRDVLAYVVHTQSLEAVLGEQVRADRVRGCPHEHVRRMSLDGSCMLCDLEGGTLAPEPPAVIASAVPADVGASLLAAIGGDAAGVDKEAADRAALEEEFALYLEVLESELARRSLAEFFRQAVKAGVLGALHNVEWAPHLQATCDHIQNMLEGWMVTQGKGTEDMIANQRALWALHFNETELAMLNEPWRHEPLVQKMIENLCPATLKSTVAMVVANAWLWLHCPWADFGALSWVDANVTRDSDMTRDLVTSAWYRSHFDVEWTIRSDQDSKKKWKNTAGGVRLSCTMQAGIVGQHVHVVFVDDPDDPVLVHLESKRAIVHSRFTALENRLHDERTGLIFILQQRTHVQDLSGFCLAKGQWSKTSRKLWAWLCIPLRYGYGPHNCPKVTPYGWSDWRSTKGECMMPSRFTPAVIADKLLSGEFFFATQYDQNPTPLVGGLFGREKLKWFIYEDELPMLAAMRKRPEGCIPREEQAPIVLKRNRYGRADGMSHVLISVDATFGSTKATASQVGITVHAKRGEELFTLDDRTKIMGPAEQINAVIQTIADWSPTCRKVIVEMKALGSMVVAEIEKVVRSGQWQGKPLLGQDGRALLVSVDAITVGSSEGKIIRGKSALPTWNAGLVYVHDGADWVYPKYNEAGKTVDAGWVGEVTAFPFGDKNDRADTFSQAVAWYRDNNESTRRTMALNSL